MYQCLTRPHFLNCIIFHFFENILYIPFTKMCARYLFILFHSNKSFGQMSAATDRADDESGDCIGHSLESVPGFSCYRSYQGGRSNEAVGRVAQFQRVAVNDAQTTVNIILGRPRREIYDRERERVPKSTYEDDYVLLICKIKYVTEDFGAGTERIWSAISRFYRRCTYGHNSFLWKQHVRIVFPVGKCFWWWNIFTDHFRVISWTLRRPTVRRNPNLRIIVNRNGSLDTTLNTQQNVSHGLRLGFRKCERATVRFGARVIWTSDAPKVGVKISIGIHACIIVKTLSFFFKWNFVIYRRKDFEGSGFYARGDPMFKKKEMADIGKQ